MTKSKARLFAFNAFGFAGALAGWAVRSGHAGSECLAFATAAGLMNCIWMWPTGEGKHD